MARRDAVKVLGKSVDLPGRGSPARLDLRTDPAGGLSASGGNGNHGAIAKAAAIGVLASADGPPRWHGGGGAIGSGKRVSNQGRKARAVGSAVGLAAAVDLGRV
jgi:hypothetical protein